MRNLLWSPASGLSGSHCGLSVFLSVCLTVCLSVAACLHYCTDSDVTWGSGKGCPLVVHYWVNLQSGHGLHCYGNITQMRNVSEYMIVLALCLVIKLFTNYKYKCTEKLWVL